MPRLEAALTRVGFPLRTKACRVPCIWVEAPGAEAAASERYQEKKRVERQVVEQGPSRVGPRATTRPGMIELVGWRP